jgi:hypothetical protein
MTRRLRLVELAHARSGDKGDRADIGLFAYDAAGYALIKQAVTAPWLADHFRGIATGPVELYPLDNLLALKIVLNGALQGGAARSLRSDNLGKCLGAALLRLEIELPDDGPTKGMETQ